MADIKMPATPRSAYDPDRSPNALLLMQVRELEKAVVEAGRRVKRQIPATEGQVAAYMRHLNRALHQQLLLPKMKRRALDVPLGDGSLKPARAKRRPATPKRASRAATKRVKSKTVARKNAKRSASKRTRTASPKRKQSGRR